MKQFAFVIHPLDLNGVSVAYREPGLTNIKPSLLHKAFEWMKPYPCAEVTGVVSRTGVKISGHLLYLSLLPEQIIRMDQKTVFNKLVDTCRLAEDLGADILGLGAYAAQIGKKGVEVSRKTRIPVTTGTNYTIYVAVWGLEKACEMSGCKLDGRTIAVVGATGKIGSVCARMLASKAGRMILSARSRSRLEPLKTELEQTHGITVEIEADARKAIIGAEVSVISTTTPEPLVDLKDLPSGAIVCDVSRPANVSNHGNLLRDDVLVMDGGVVRPPGKELNLNFYIGLPQGVTYACMAETMLLAMEERYESYSIGGDVSLQKVRETGAWGHKHGFELAEIMSFGRTIPAERVRRLSKSFREKPK
ncbi:MAG: shikimate dehydrogenase [Candidatus Omnitrophica bacterium]|nr:shikimate dehydrogenase [Candidatus Omnitrophota bacterium]